MPADVSRAGDVDALAARAFARVPAAAHPRQQRRRLRSDGPDRGGRLGRLGARDRDQPVRLGAAVPRGAAALQARTATARSSSSRAAAPPTRCRGSAPTRRRRRRSSASPRRWRRRCKDDRHRRQRDRAGRARTRGCSTRCSAGPDAVGDGVLRAHGQAASRQGGTPLETGAALAVFLGSAASDGITGRLLSAVWDPWADAAGASRRSRRDRRLHAAPDRRRRIAASDWGPADEPAALRIVGCGLIGTKRAAALGGAPARRLRRHRRGARATRSRAASPGAVADRSTGGALVDAARRRHRRSSRRRTMRCAEIARRRSRPASTCSSRSRRRASVAELDRADRRRPSAARRLVRVGFNHRYHPALLKGARARRRRRARRP